MLDPSSINTPKNIQFRVLSNRFKKYKSTHFKKLEVENILLFEYVSASYLFK